MPLALLVSWYGMNCKYMPKLNHPYGYPVIIFGSDHYFCICNSLFHYKK
ncbi:CorA family divalent cation transporter [Streptococcus halichoeri]